MPPRHRLPDYVTVQAPRQSGLVVPDLSVVIPAYNEAYRIPQYLDAIHEYFSLRGEAHELSVMDTQCGFKLFDSIAAEALFRLARVDGFAFDVEILHLADKARIPVTEAAVTWRDSGTSRVSLLTEPAKMVRDVWRIRRMHRGTVVSVDRTTPSAARAEP